VTITSSRTATAPTAPTAPATPTTSDTSGAPGASGAPVKWRTFVSTLNTPPGWVRVLAAVTVLMVAAFTIVAALAIRDARKGLQVIGHAAGPQVVATTNLYYALSDMDAQLASALLIGRDDLGAGRGHALELYERRRSEADRALLQAAELAAGDQTEQQTARTLLDGFGRYELLAGQALTLDRQSGHDAGPPPANVTNLFRQATDLMKLDLLPKAYNLTLASGATVNSVYQARRSATLSGRTGVAVAGLVTVLVLAGLQIYLTTRFRRLINLWLVLATLGTAALTVASAALLSAEADYLWAAKTRGFDSVLTLSRTRAIDKSMDADRSRSLLDPQDADRYDQMYFDKAQTILYIPGVRNLADYYAELHNRLDRYQNDAHSVGFTGLYGVEARQVDQTDQTDLRDQERASLGALLAGYERSQDNDRRVRQLTAEGEVEKAAKAQVDPSVTYLPHPSFRTHDEGLAALITRHQYTVDREVLDGRRAVAAWPWLLTASVLVIAGLVVAGVRPRLKEYR
jgi:hypothetical protein